MIVIIAGTNRTDSRSSEMAQHLSERLQNHQVESKIIDLKDIPADYLGTALYENSGKNNSFNDLREPIATAEKLLFVIPEYNGSFPGVLKAFMDGLKFPEGVKGKKTGLIGISSGPMGGALALSHFTDILNYMGCSVLANKPRITNIDSNFENGSLKDHKVNTIVEDMVQQLIQF